jgi:hypothetical protein
MVGTWCATKARKLSQKNFHPFSAPEFSKADPQLSKGLFPFFNMNVGSAVARTFDIAGQHRPAIAKG